MSRNIDSDSVLKNHLLANTWKQDSCNVRPALEPISLSAGQVLHRPGDRFDYIYFPATALISLLVLSESGTTVAVGLIGSEGVVGFEVYLGVDSGPIQAEVQTPGIAYRIPAGDLQAKCANCGHSPQCQQAALIYTQALMTQVSQTAVCNRFHPVSQRYARWILETADRLDAPRLAMTHEQVAGFLGTRRESITLAANELATLGLIKIGRGNVVIRDRPGLESAACECYEVVSSEYGRLLGPVFQQPPQKPGQAHPSQLRKAVDTRPLLIR